MTILQQINSLIKTGAKHKKMKKNLIVNEEKKREI